MAQEDHLIWITIDNQSLKVPPGITILEAARLAGINLPTICFHEHLTPNAVCRVCLVEMRGTRTLVPACVGTVVENAVILTDSHRVRVARRTILEMLASAVDLSEAPEILDMLDELGGDPERFGPETSRRTFADVKDDNPFYIRDYDKCILCWRCVQVCADDVQYTYALGFNNRGFHTEIATYFNVGMPDTSCVFCGNCVGVCPTGALKDRRAFRLSLMQTT